LLKRNQESVFEDLPFLGILRGFYEDPYYKLQLHMPSFRLRDFYRAHLGLKFNNQLEAFFPRLRSEIIESQKESLISGAERRLSGKLHPPS
jgi:hypothetical protein